jgi:hypothetical protein
MNSQDACSTTQDHLLINELWHGHLARGEYMNRLSGLFHNTRSFILVTRQEPGNADPDALPRFSAARLCLAYMGSQAPAWEPVN